MFTPHPVPPGGRNDAEPSTLSRMPSGSSLLFPSFASGGGRHNSPLMSSTTPRVPFTGGTMPGMDALAPPLAPAFTPAAPRSIFASRTGMPAATPSASSAAAAADEMPPLQSLLDVTGPREPLSAARPLATKTPATGHGRAAQPDAAPGSVVPPAPAAPSAYSGAGGATNATAADDGALWVTAFGYHSTAMLSAVLEELRPSGGEVLAHKMGTGPWVHIRYVDWRQQQQALAKNGKVLHGSMLGVIAGIHPSADGIDLPMARPASAIPLRLQQQRPVGPALRAPPVSRVDLAKAGWWTRLCELVFGW